MFELPTSIRSLFRNKAASRAGVVALIALAASTSVALRNFDEPYAVQGGAFSDHFSHMCSTVMFLAKGLDIYRKPVRENLEHSTQPKDILFAHENRLGTRELFVNPFGPKRPPLAINWSGEIRAYPPGVYLLFLPVALPFQFEKLSFENANRLIILALVIVGALNTFALFCYAFMAEDRWAMALRLVSAAFASYWIERWALRGFYDVVSLLFIFLSLWEMERKRWLDCILFYCAAVFVHYRALYYAPVSLIALAMAWKEGRAHGEKILHRWALHPEFRAKFWIALAMALAAGVCFWVALPQLESFAAFNPLYHFYSAWKGLSWELLLALTLGAGTLGLMAADRDWTAALVLLCYFMFLVRTPQACQWHSLFLAPLVLLCSRRSRSWLGRAEWASMLVLSMWLGIFVYQVY